MFMEQVDYKMQIEDGSDTNPKELKPVDIEPMEEEKRSAFKKKLRKYSSKKSEPF